MARKGTEAYKAMLLKGKEIRAKNRETKKYTCIMCSIKFNYRQGRTKGDACDDCNKKYRTLYNLLHSAKHRANKQGLDFDLDIEWLKSQPTVCPFLGEEMLFGSSGSDFSNRSALAASIDKIDPSKGYTKDNCQLVSWWFNAAKQRYTSEEVICLCKKVVDTYTTQLAQNAEKMEEIIEGII